jgi:hypothetical protein
VKRRAPRPSVSPEAAALLRAALEPRYGRKLDDGEVGAAVDRLRRFSEVMVGWEVEDRARAAQAEAETETALPPSSNNPPGAAK